ncbi:NAD-binding protein [Acidovorax sp.]|uniref:NAD-binding protein n=1 Tax=Acidovorax sp. TaxID=1872122 RepID=UPI0031E01AF5
MTPRTQQSLTQVVTQKASTTSNKNVFGDHGNLAGTKAECNEQVNCIIISAHRCWDLHDDGYRRTGNGQQHLRCAEVRTPAAHSAGTTYPGTSSASQDPKKIAVAGIGYVGLSVAVLLAQHHDVVLIDIAPDKVQQVSDRISPFCAPDIQQHLSDTSLRLEAT